MSLFFLFFLFLIFSPSFPHSLPPSFSPSPSPSLPPSLPPSLSPSLPQAQEAYEGVIKQARELHNMAAAPPTILSEYKLWEEHWCRCAQELGQWDTLNEFGKSQNGANPFLGKYIHVFYVV